MKSSWLMLVLFLSAGALLAGCEPEQCSPSTCGGCCDSNNQCIPQETQSTLACGAYGQACAPCALSQICRNAVCQLPINMSGGGAGGGSGGGSAGGGGSTGGGGGALGGGAGGGTGGGATGGGVGGGTGGGGATGGGTGGGGATDAGLPFIVGCWNIEWFADPPQADGGYNGPYDNALQQQNVLTALRARPEVDLWGFEEIVGTTEFSTVVSGMSGFSTLLPGDVTGGSFYYASWEQKVGFAYRTSKITVLSAQLILTAYNFDFAGRPPLEAHLRVQGNGVTKDLYVIVLHMKAFGDPDAYDRRLAASAALKSYLDASRANESVLVIGDWNDDVDVSTVTPNPSPYANFVSDSTHYKFPTKELSDANRRTTAFNSTIDHQMMTAPLFSSYVTSSSAATVPSIPSYVSTTSDHYPVTARYVFR